MSLIDKMDEIAKEGRETLWAFSMTPLCLLYELGIAVGTLAVTTISTPYVLFRKISDKIREGEAVEYDEARGIEAASVEGYKDIESEETDCRLRREYETWKKEEKEKSLARKISHGYDPQKIIVAEDGSAKLKEFEEKGGKVRDCQESHALMYTHFMGVDFTYFDFSRSILKGTDFRGAYLMGADLSEADCRYADFHGADMTGAKLDGMVIDDGEGREYVLVGGE